MWNKAIELSTKTHPGPVVHLSDSPRDEGKLLIGYENGTVVFWDLKSKRAELRVYYDEAIHSIDWHHEGKQFMCSHSDGSLTLWNLKSPSRPFQTTIPHGKSQREGRKSESCKPILKVEYKTCRNRYAFFTLGDMGQYIRNRQEWQITFNNHVLLKVSYNYISILTG